MPSAVINSFSWAFQPPDRYAGCNWAIISWYHGTGYADLTYTVQLNSEEYGVGFRKGSDLAAALNDFFFFFFADGSIAACAETYNIQAALIDVDMVEE